ncbi:MAG: Ig-like domain-containing protein [Algiphilus sp.]|uniref:Ig-like domain-containing protein n=1 Tax=Algiphilus sp. TaxID=1872431 RepID=UPI0032EE382C
MPIIRQCSAVGAFFMACALTACGGDATLGSGGGGFGGGDPDTDNPGQDVGVADLVVLQDRSELPSDAVNQDQGIVLTAQVRDAANRLVSGASVDFAATSGALQVVSGTTDSQGRASAILTTGGDASLRDITVLASSEEVEQTVTIPVVAPNRPTPPEFRLGVTRDGAFEAGEIGIGQTPLSAGGSSGLNLNLVDIANNNQPFDGNAEVQFTSACIGDNLSTVVPNPAPLNSGSVSVSYRAQGCSGDDAITARVQVGGESLQANGVINVEPAELGSITFVDADPDFVGLQGSGRPTTSRVTFRVEDVSGGPVVGETVRFSLNTSVGGISITPPEGTTDGNGEVQTTVSAGTVATTVRVTATVTRDGETIRSQSDQLVVSTNIPDNDSFSVAVECFNVEGWRRDGATTGITIRAADRFNNPVPDGTAISLTTEGGSVEPGCQTTDGSCVVTWTSQDPRPQAFNGCESVNGTAGTDERCSIVGSEGASRAGRSAVLVTAIGEESFTDLNGDGRYDSEEQFADLPEAFRDDDSDGRRDLDPQFRNGGEEFLDFDNNSVYNDGDNRFTGVLCNDPAACSPEGARTLNVRRVVPVIMSDSSPLVDNSRDVLFSGSTASFSPSTSTFSVDSNQNLIIAFVLRDLNDQPLPAETSISLSVDGDGELVGTTGYAVPCTTDDTAQGNTYGFAFKASELDPGDPDGSALLQLSVESPGGLVSIFSYSVRVIAPPPPPPEPELPAQV